MTRPSSKIMIRMNQRGSDYGPDWRSNCINYMGVAVNYIVPLTPK